MADRVIIFDTTLRDGEQSPGYSMNIGEKLKMAEMLDSMGVDVIEGGFPASSRGDFDSVHKVAQLTKNATIAGLSRAVEKDIDATLEAIKPAKSRRLHIVLATSPLHMKHKLNKSPDEVLEMIKASVAYGRKHVDDIEFSAEDATRSEPEFLCRAIEAAIAAGATTVNIPDTVGYTLPVEYFELVKLLKEKVKGIEKAVISTHCHNDLGLAVANSLAAVRAGARQIECTINGIGERAGNASLEEVVMAFRVRHDLLPFETGVKSEMLMPASKLLSQITGFSVQPNKAIVGANAFSHESGIHQDGVLKNAKTYEIMTPESVGRDRSEIVLGKHSGRNAFRTRLKALGFEFENDEEFGAAFQRFKDFADVKKKVSDEDLMIIAAAKDGLPKARIEFTGLGVRSGSFGPQEAEVEIVFEGEVKKGKGVGKGPVDACFRALRGLVPHEEAVLADYQLKALTQGSDAKGEVNVKLTEYGHHYTGTGVDTDVIVASCRAYIDALNNLLEGRAALAEKLKTG